MDWRFLVTIIITVALGITTIVLALKLVKKRQPVWAYRTTKVIGLGSNAPLELKLTFNEQPVSDVYRTRVILFNKGNETILRDNVTEGVTIQFRGAEILRQPDVKAKSKEAIEFSAKQVVKGGCNSIEVSFLYLDHDDGAVVDVLHTASEGITCTTDIIGSRQLKNIGGFEPHPPERQRENMMSSLVIVAVLSGLLLYDWLSSRVMFEESPEFLVVYGLIVAGSAAILIPYFRYRRFPRWSAITD